MKRCWILTAREKEFIEDWLMVMDGRMDKIYFFKKWSKGKGDFYKDYELFKKGKISLEDFSERWMKKGEWKNLIRVMKYRINLKMRNLEKIMNEIEKEINLMKKFMEVNEWP
ncbi:MAG: hypothetical protein RMH75_06070 [Archaeoglobaceae archaeon]|nr:hypothetical protein [Archaeoglobaceae archaeon]MDW7990211.1 hypothetical protein [Archaeoglobaceae archaeon]